MKLTFCYRHIAPYHHAQLTEVSHAGHDVTVLSYDNFNGAAFAQPAALSRSFRVITINEPKGTWNVLLQALKESSPDVIIVPGWGHAYALAALSWAGLNKIPCVVISDSQELDHPRNWWQEKVKQRIIRHFSAGFVAGKRSFEYLSNLGMPFNKIVIGCDVVDNDHFINIAREARAAESAMREQLGLPDRFFLAVNRLIPEKNIHTILMAYASYRTSGAPGDWKLIIVGEGLLRNELLELSRELKIESFVYFISTQTYDDMPCYYALASALILASVQETWGFAVNEAMACSIPVIVSTHCGCSPDLVVDGENGFTFPPASIERLTEIMIDFARDRYDRNAMGSQGQSIVGHWSLNRYVENLDAVVSIAKDSLPRTRSWVDNKILSMSIANLSGR